MTIFSIKNEDAQSTSSFVMVEDDQKSKQVMELRTEEEQRPSSSLSSSSSSSLSLEKKLVEEEKEEEKEEKIEKEEEKEEENEKENEKEEEKEEKKEEKEEEKEKEKEEEEEKEKEEEKQEEEKLEAEKETLIETVRPMMIINELPAEIRITLENVPIVREQQTQTRRTTLRKRVQEFKSNLTERVSSTKSKLAKWSKGNRLSIFEIVLILSAFLIALFFGSIFLVPFCALIPLRRIRRRLRKRRAEEDSERDMIGLENYRKKYCGRKH